MNLINKLKNDLSYGDSFDMTFREVLNEKHRFSLVFFNFLVSSESITRIIYSLNNYKEESNDNLITKVLLNEAVKVLYEYEEIYESVLNGDLIIVVDDEQLVLSCEVKKYPDRGIIEPASEKVVRGSKEGFIENFAINIALIRRRIKSGKLKIIHYKIGKISKTNVALVYLDGYINYESLKEIKDKLSNLVVDEITMSDKALEEFLMNRKYVIFPLVKYTERPDTFVSHLYQGKFGIIVDNSPSVLLAPVNIFDHLQHAEEFRQNIISGSFLRFVRIIGIIVSYFIVPVWLILLRFDFSNVFIFSKFFEVNASLTTVFIQVMIMELGVEFLRMASIHTPDALSTSMGLIAGIVLGELAISMGIISEPIVLLGAVSAIGSFITPSYELSLANKITKLILIIFTYLFGLIGFISTIFLLIIYLATLKSFNKPYLYPLIPFNFKKMLKQIFRLPFKKHHDKIK